MTTTPGADLPLTERDVTFLIADLAGFTAVTEIHGSRHAAWVVTRYVAIVRATLHPAARLAERVGDAVLIVAPEAASAVRTAVDLRAATERESLFPLLRLGIHGGPVVELNGSYFGTPLNLTARLAAYAAPGQILCTETVASAASGLEGVEFRDLGLVTLKNIVAPVSIFEVATSRQLGSDLIDPVCQMRVDPLTAASQLAHCGRTYLFCSPECARAFAAQVGHPGAQRGRSDVPASGRREGISPGAAANAQSPAGLPFRDRRHPRGGWPGGRWARRGAPAPGRGTDASPPNGRAD
jgi:adenylate cyclase